MSSSKSTTTSGGVWQADTTHLDSNSRRPNDPSPDRERAFKQENAEGFASMNAWVEQNGLPLEKLRQF